MPLPVGSSKAEERLARLRDLMARLAAIPDLDDLLVLLVDELIGLTGARRGAVILTADSDPADWRQSRGLAEAGLQEALGRTLVASVLTSQAPLLLKDALRGAQFDVPEVDPALRPRSVLCVPIVSRSTVLGALYLDDPSAPGRFSPLDLEMVALLAQQLALVLDRARLADTARQTSQELAAMAHTLEQRVAERTAELQRTNVALARVAVQLETSSQVGQYVTSILDLDELLGQVVELIQVRSRTHFVGIWLLADHGDAIVLRAGTGEVGACLAERPVRLSPDPLHTRGLDSVPVFARLWQTRTAQVIADAAAEPDYLAMLPLPATRSALLLPLQVGDTVIGALDIRSEQPAAFGPEDRVMLQTLAYQISVAIRNAELYNAEQRQRQLAEALEQTGRVLSSSLDLHTVPGRFLVELAQVVPYERGLILLKREDGLACIAEHGREGEGAGAFERFPIHPGSALERVIRTRRAVLVDDLAHDPGQHEAGWLPEEQSWLGVPLVSKDRVLGLLSLTRAEKAAFTPDDAQLALAFAAQAAIALENAELYDEIKRFSEQLEAMVDQRTGELNRAYQTLERLDQTKADFIGVVAHELRTPLTVIKGYCQMLQINPTVTADPTTGALLAGILSGSARLHEIINVMLDVTKIDSDALRLYHEPTLVLEVLRGIEIEYRPALLERNLTLEVADLSGLPPVQVDTESLTKVFTHLIVNAIKYTPDGGRITVSGREVTDHTDRPSLEVVVSDTGIGIDPEHHELIFAKFYQTGEVALHSTGRTKFKGGGPGLGLAVVRGIVEAYGGRVWCESPGHDETRCPGSRFYLRLPVIQWWRPPE